ncbi:MAG: Cys-Gln thioester bond-forming surface protein [Bacilli bacterium]|nr:Cys-Gln thioester bond-forming surface protein [Bacilli bacterium]
MKTKKIGKYVLSFLLIAVTIVSTLGSVYAETLAPNTITLSSSQAVKGYIGDSVNFGTKTLTDGRLAYCLEYNKPTPVNTTATLKEEMDAGMAYLIENGYPNKSITGDKEKDYFITQTAIWWYLDDTTNSNNLPNSFKTTDSDPHNLRPIIINLKEKAKEAKKIGNIQASINVSVGNSALSLSSDKNYFVSDEIKVTLESINDYSVVIENAPEGTYIGDITGNKKTTFKKGENFKVYVPADKVLTEIQKIRLMLKNNTRKYKVYKYSPADSREQDIVPAILYPVDVAVNKELNLTVVKDKEKFGQANIIKIDASTKKAVAGATLVVKNEAGEEIAKFTTTEEVYKLENLKYGKYTVEEIAAPAGYQLSDKVYSFIIDKDNDCITVTFENYPAIPVPNTNSNKEVMMYILGTLLMISGVSFTIYNAKKQK